MIDAYIDELSETLRGGPRSARVDLLTEARDSLVDAADQYQLKGLDRQAAERRAVREFGAVRVIAPEYQTELGLAQARRTALVVFAVVATQTLVSELAWRSAATGWTWQPNTAYMLLAHLVDYASYAVLGGSLLAAIACGPFLRYVRAGRAFVRATGLGALATCGFFAIGGLLLTAFSPFSLSLPSGGIGLAAAAITWSLPACVIYSGRRCLRAA